MNPKLRNILLKSIPYLLSIAGGITLFVLTKDNVHNPNVADLINNIASSLLSIPVVFLLYDYSNYRISRQLNKTLASNMSSRVSNVVLNLAITVRSMLGLRGKITLESINKMQNLRPSNIASRLKITPAHMQSLRDYHTALEDIIYKYGRNSVMDGGSVQNLSGLMMDLLRLINEHQFRRDRHAAAKYIVDIIGRISDWLDSDAGAAMNFSEMLASAMDADGAK